MHKLIAILCCLFLTILFIVTRSKQHVVPQPPSVVKIPEQVVSPDLMLSVISAESLKEKVYSLAGMDGRLAGTAGAQKAANYIENELRKVGLQTMRDPFTWRNKKTENIYGWIEGQEHKDEIMVVGAHYDHIGTSPGADDNASGTAMVLELAKAFSKTQPKRTIVFQLYSAEEYGLWGSKHYCQNPKFPINAPDLQKHVFMMNIDMVGYLGRQTSQARASQVNKWVLDGLINDLSKKYPFARSISKRGGGGSDQESFITYGQGNIAVIWLFTGTHINYHRPTDTPDKINYSGMEQICKYASEMLYYVSQGQRGMLAKEKTEQNLEILDSGLDHGVTPYLGN